MRELGATGCAYALLPARRRAACAECRVEALSALHSPSNGQSPTVVIIAVCGETQRFVRIQRRARSRAPALQSRTAELQLISLHLCFLQYRPSLERTSDQKGALEELVEQTSR